MIECNDLFDYGYKIYQNKNFFKFSIDSILLSEFVKFKRNDKILDMCTGNAPLPMILTTKEKNLEIDAIEIQPEIYELARKSIEFNNIKNISIFNDDIKTIKLDKKYDIITCNPPYFKVNDKSMVNDNEIKKIARHEVKLTLDDVVNRASDLLKETGTFYMVHRVDRLVDVIDSLKRKKLGIRRICFVFTKKDTEAEFFLIEASKYKRTDPKVTYLNIKNLTSYKNIF